MKQAAHKINQDAGKHEVDSDISAIVRDISYLYRNEERISREGKQIIGGMLSKRFSLHNEAIEARLDKMYNDFRAQGSDKEGDSQYADRYRAMKGEQRKVKDEHTPYTYGDMWAAVDSMFLTNRGKFPKRLAAYIKKELGIKIDKSLQELISVCGEVARAHVSKPAHVWYDIVDSIDWEGGEFGDRGSCYWGEYAGSKDMIEQAGGGALRVFVPPTSRQLYNNLNGTSQLRGRGRVWIIPTNHQGNHYYVMFNAYGAKFNLIKATRILANILGLSYHKVSLYNNGLYVNGDNAYILGKREDIDALDYPCEIRPGLDSIWRDENEDRSSCDHCGGTYDEDDLYHVENWGEYCENCRGDLFTYCEHGEHDIRIGDHNMYIINPHDDNICDDCFNSSDLIMCHICGCVDKMEESLVTADTENWYCRDCWSEVSPCNMCADIFEDVAELEGESYCDTCYDIKEQELESENKENG